MQLHGYVGRWTRRTGPALLAGLAIGLTGALSPRAAPAQTEILLAPGDTISYSVIGAPELGNVAMIGVDGQIQLPLAGWIDAAGVSIRALRETVIATVSGRPFRVTGTGGEDVWRRVSPDDVLIDIAAYRPVYLTGDVRGGGEIPYRPGLTLRQAIAQGGGLGLALDTTISPVELLELSTQRDLLVDQIAFTRAARDRLEIDLAAIGAAPSGEQVDLLDTSIDSARRWLAARDSERQLAEDSTDLRMEQMESRLEVLKELEVTNRANREIEEGLIERARTLVERGVAPAATLIEAQRSLLQMSMQELQTSNELFTLQLDMARTSSDVERLLTAQRVALLAQITELRTSLVGHEKRLSALDQRIALLGGQLMITDSAPRYRFEIYRTGVETPMTSDRLTDLLLMPGDVLEVTLLPVAPPDTAAPVSEQTSALPSGAVQAERQDP
jgi:polysaccharide export outer membrane protein